MDRSEKEFIEMKNEGSNYSDFIIDLIDDRVKFFINNRNIKKLTESFLDCWRSQGGGGVGLFRKIFLSRKWIVSFCLIYSGAEAIELIMKKVKSHGKMKNILGNGKNIFYYLFVDTITQNFVSLQKH